MGIFGFEGTVTLRKSLRNRVHIVAWRPKGKYRKTDIKWIPYHLAMWLQLLPTSSKRDGFTSVLYQFGHKDLDDLKAVDWEPGQASPQIKKVARSKDGMEVVVTIDISGV